MTTLSALTQFGCGPSGANRGSVRTSQHATRVAAADPSLDESYFWRNDHTVLFLRHAVNTNLFHAELADTRTGRITLPPAFNARQSSLMKGERMDVFVAGSSRGVTHYIPPSAALSPDGKWLLWLSTSRAPDFRWIAATLDGQTQQWKQTGDSNRKVRDGSPRPLWFRDSRKWVELVGRRTGGSYEVTMANVYELGRAAPVRHVYIEGLEEGLPVGITRDSEAMMYHRGDSHDRHVEEARFTHTPINAEFVTARSVTVPIPTSAWIESVALSPNGDRLAWILEAEETGGRPGAPGSPVTDWLTRKVGPRKTQTRQFTIYVSEVDGTDLHPVATVEGVWSHGRFAFAHEVGWLPDGKQVSFVYDDALWTVPVH